MNEPNLRKSRIFTRPLASAPLCENGPKQQTAVRAAFLHCSCGWGRPAAAGRFSAEIAIFSTRVARTAQKRQFRAGPRPGLSQCPARNARLLCLSRNVMPLTPCCSKKRLKPQNSIAGLNCSRCYTESLGNRRIQSQIQSQADRKASCRERV